MFERFTDRSHRVMQLAKNEALRYNRKSIGIEHVFLGLLKEGSGVGATVLKNCDLDLEKVRREIEMFIPYVDSVESVTSVDYIPQGGDAKKLIENAINYARKMKHNYVGTEHILYALASEEKGIAPLVFKNFNLTKEHVIRELEGLLKAGESLKQESSQEATKSAQNYWMIPRGNVDFVKFLEICGYEIHHSQEGGDNFLPIMRRDSNRELLLMELGKINLTKRDSPEIKIKYFPEDATQMNEALDLRDIFDANNIRYKEEPNPSEILDELKRPLKSINNLIDRLERRVQD